MILKDLTRIKGEYVWEFVQDNNKFSWIVKNKQGENIGQSYISYQNLEECILNASINGYSENITKVEDSWVFYYKNDKGYRWQRLDNNEGEIISQSIHYFKDREECIKNASIFGF